MGLLETVLLTVGVSVGTTALAIAAVRAGLPWVQRVFGYALKTRATLDADRDRIIDGLRGEVADLNRRANEANERAVAAEQESQRLRRELSDLNRFVDQLLSRLHMTREQVEHGDETPPYRRRRPPRAG